MIFGVIASEDQITCLCMHMCVHAQIPRREIKEAIKKKVEPTTNYMYLFSSYYFEEYNLNGKGKIITICWVHLSI